MMDAGDMAHGIQHETHVPLNTVRECTPLEPTVLTNMKTPY